MPEVLRQVAVGAKVSIKGGLIVGYVEEVRPEGLMVAVIRTPRDSQPLETEKGINFPGTTLEVWPLSAEDLKTSTSSPSMRIWSAIHSCSGKRTSHCCRRSWRSAGRPSRRSASSPRSKLGLPSTISPRDHRSSCRHQPVRGDDCAGRPRSRNWYERLSEVQEEILWVCEAAHVPVIWATQVLESLVKRGMPSRGELTDAAMGNPPIA